jgi:hypothetical protein
MRQRRIGAYIATLFIFGLFGLTQYTENVRTVQVLGLFACGMACGVSLVGIVTALRRRREESNPA